MRLSERMCMAQRRGRREYTVTKCQVVRWTLRYLRPGLCRGHVAHLWTQNNGKWRRVNGGVVEGQFFFLCRASTRLHSIYLESLWGKRLAMILPIYAIRYGDSGL